MQRTTRTALLTGGLVVAMGGLSFAAAPFYDWFCRTTGFGGATVTGSAEGVEVLDRTVTVRFDAGTERGMPWDFRPEVREMEVRLGETALAYFRATNPTDRPVAGQASFNVVPLAAGAYFVKVECFCFTEQVLGPGESVDMPVSFFVDPAILDDPDGRGVHEITLGYTFYEIDLPESDAAPEEQAALRPAALPGAADRAID